MARPGVDVVLLEEPPARTPPTDTSMFFAVGPAAQGDQTKAILVRSMSEFETVFGTRQTYSYLWDAMDCYFKEGGSQAYIARVVGPAPVKSTFTLQDSTPANTLHVTAQTPGAWGNDLAVAVIAGDSGGQYKIQISSISLGTVLEVSGNLLTKQDAITWSQSSQYVTITDVGTGNVPALTANQPLIGGTDDNTNITEAQWTTALGLFTKDLGPGQVAMPGRTTLAAQQNLLQHANDNNRVALIDQADSGSRATLVAAATALRSFPNDRHGELHAPWAQVPGISAGTTRIVPWSAIQAGIIARNDGQGLSPNVAAAGITYGQSLYAIGLSQPGWSDSDREALNDAGVNIVVEKFGGIMMYGYRTVVDPNLDPNWVEFSNARLYMAIVADADAIAEGYVFRQLDGKGLTIGEFNGDLAAMLMQYYNEGSLYGDSPATAFVVDTGPNVNTTTTIQNRELHAVLHLHMSPFAEWVQVQIVKRLLTELI